MRNIRDAQVAGLVEVLLDESASSAERDDAAMDLGAVDNDTALHALLEVATSRFEQDELVLASCGESIANLWLKRGRFDPAAFARLTPAARKEARALVKANRPEWLTDDS